MKSIKLTKHMLIGAKDNIFYILIKWLLPIIGIVISYFIYNNSHKGLFKTFFFSLVLWAIFNRMFLLFAINIKNSKGNTRIIMNILKFKRFEYLFGILSYFLIDTFILTSLYLFVGKFAFKIDVNTAQIFKIFFILLLSAILFPLLGVAIESLFSSDKNKTIVLLMSYLVLMITSTIYIPSEIIDPSDIWFKYIAYFNPLASIKHILSGIINNKLGLNNLLICTSSCLIIVLISILILFKKFRLSK